MIAGLSNASIGQHQTAVRVGTVESPEAIMLVGLAFKRKWQNRRKAEGKPCDKPNIELVTGANIQVKLREGYYVMDHVKAAEMVDENIIRVAAILGSTLIRKFEEDSERQEIGWGTPIHINVASDPSYHYNQVHSCAN